MLNLRERTAEAWKTIPPEPWLVRLDETKYWNDEELVKKAGTIYSVYLFDRSVYHHLCELTPSFELRRLYTEFTNHDHSDSENESIMDQIVEASIDDQIFDYMHVSYIDRLLKDNPGYGVNVSDSFDNKYYDWKVKEEYEKGMDDLEDHYRSNWRL